MTVRPIPKGYHTVTPYLAVKGARKLLEFVKKAFGAKVRDAVDGPRGKLMHAEVRIGDSMVMMGEALPASRQRAVMLCLYVRKVDAVWRQAVKAGGKSLQKPADMFYGDRAGAVQDASGTQWWIHTHIEDLSAAEIRKRAAEIDK